MDARQRMADVKQLRNDVLHDFFNMIIQSGWQNSLYQLAYDQVTNNWSLKDAYSEVYSKMRQLNLNNLASEYSVEDMDISLMRTVASYWNSRGNRSTNYAPMESRTLDALKNIKEDRNEDGHSSGNEDEEEIYLQGLLSLVNLRHFVKTVDKVEITRISDPDRLAYYKKYMDKINTLKDTLDDERIRLVQTTKNIDRDIEKILRSDKQLETYVYISKLYMDRSMLDKDNPEGITERETFYVRASDAGIAAAHSEAALHYIYIEKNPEEAIRRIRMMIDSDPDLNLYGCVSIIGYINDLLRQGCELTGSMQQILNIIKEKDIEVVQRDGRFFLPEYERREEERRREREEEMSKEWVIRIKPSK